MGFMTPRMITTGGVLFESNFNIYEGNMQGLKKLFPNINTNQESNFKALYDLDSNTMGLWVLSGLEITIGEINFMKD